MEFVPERLRDIRIMKGYTVEALADELQISKQAVSKYEGGKMIPASDVLDRLLKLFFIPRGYLTKPDALPKERSAVFYRRCKRTPNKELLAAQIYLKWCYEMIDAGRDYFLVREADLPERRDGMTAEDMAREVRMCWNLGSDPIRRLGPLLEEHGFFLFSASLSNEKIDGYSQMIGGVPIMIVNQNRGNRMRQQFSMAHELGHLLLHRGIENPDEETLERMEAEADQFAGCFLMPERELSADLIRRDAEYMVSLGEKWCVSPHAVVERCQRIHAFSDDSNENAAYAQMLFQRLNRRKSSGQEDAPKLCSIREGLLDICRSERTGREFLQKLQFPAEEVRRLCFLPDDAFYSPEWEERETADDLEGVQLSFVF